MQDTTRRFPFKPKIYSPGHVVLTTLLFWFYLGALSLESLRGAPTKALSTRGTLLWAQVGI